MNHANNPSNVNYSPESDRLLALLSDVATGVVLIPQEQAELDSLLRRVPQLTDQAGNVITADSVERAAGAFIAGMSVGGAATAKSASMPADVRERLLRRGAQIAAENRDLGGLRSAVAPGLGSGSRAGEAGGSSGALGFVGWLIAAASIALAAITYVNSRPPVLPTVKEQVAMLENKGGTLKLDWAAQGDYANKVTGRVIWNSADQKGFVRFKNLTPNDPKVDQFQLWIFDGDRKDYPVDGGVFDIAAASFDAATGEYIIPMKPALSVSKPTLFAVTVEKPGGVVVTDKSRLVVVAPVPDGK